MKHSRAISQAVRAGEGAVIRVTKEVEQAPDGSPITKFSMNLAEAPTPARSYIADAAAVTRDGEVVKLLLAQRPIPDRQIQGLLVIQMTADKVQAFLETCRDFIPGLSSFLAERRLSKPAPLDLQQEMPETVVLPATQIIVARNGYDSIMDFYYLSARSISDLQKGQTEDLAIDPVVRVVVRTALVATILDGMTMACESFSQETGDV